MSMAHATPPSHGYSYVHRKRRAKSDWAGVNIGDAFKSNIDYYTRLSAQRIFYGTIKKIQRLSANIASGTSEDVFQPHEKPQLSPCYTTYPSNLAVFAAIGMTGYLEYKSRAEARFLIELLKESLECPEPGVGVNVDPASYHAVAMTVTKTVQERLFIEDLSRIPAMATIEIYRLFLASQQKMDFNTLREMIAAVVLFGDVLPNWRDQNLHPMTRQMLEDMTETSDPFFTLLSQNDYSKLPEICVQWVKSLCATIARYLPEPKPDEPISEEIDSIEEFEHIIGRIGERKGYKFTNEKQARQENDEFPPLNDPRPPSLTDGPSLPAQIAEMIEQGKEAQNPGTLQPPDWPDNGESGLSRNTEKILKEFSNAVDRAGKQSSEWEDMRSDLIEQTMRQSAFRQGPIQGSPTDGHEVQVRLNAEHMAGGEIFDRAVELSDDLPAYERLLDRSRPVADALKLVLYPNIKQIPETERLCTSGSLDPSRLALATFSQVVFKRYRIHQRADMRGRPVLLIACDGSGSLNDRQMGMLKVLAAAWLDSTIKSQIQVLAGLYHSGQIRNGVSGPLVQWMFHPHKTPSFGRKDAVRTLVSLPDSGTGVQSDALSIAFMLEEATKIAKGKMIYLILISDCRWNRSFDTDKSGREEVISCFKSAYENLAGKLHTTLVALGVEGRTKLEDQLDKVITVSKDKLEDYVAVAEQISVYVASCIKERKKNTRARIVTGRQDELSKR
ncbi:MAG: hypothetical protein P9M14_11190 [Candidatus Alcyoniella australis]|nr:hypothetical protein [Candidatus Alcyoniella australis]